MDDTHVPDPTIIPPFIQDQIIIYGVDLIPIGGSSYVQITLEGPLILEIKVLSGANNLPKDQNYAIVAAYGYAYEGQCYRFDKTKVLAFPMVPKEAALGCGYGGLAYSMWRVRPKLWVIELNVSIGDFEKLVLEANLPGKRPPNTYASHHQVGRRSP